MKRQLLVIWEMRISPIKTLAALPSNQFFLVSFLVYLAAVAQNIISIHFIFNESEDDNRLFLISALVVSAFVLLFLISVLIIKWIVRLFGKRLTFKKVFNISGYSYIPKIMANFLSLLVFGSYESPEVGSPPVGWSEGRYAWVSLFILSVSFSSLLLLIGSLANSQEEDEQVVEPQALQDS